jgi:hypothetical protein
MKAAEAILAAGVAVLLAGCMLRGSPKVAQSAPAPPKPVVAAAPVRPVPALSITQTQAELPPAQPLTPEAIATMEPPPEEPAPAQSVPKPTRSRSVPAAHTEPAAPPANVPAAPPTSEPPERPPVGEIVPAEEQRQFLVNAQHDRQEAIRLLEQVSGRSLNRRQQNNKKSAESYLKLSTEAEQQGDLRQSREFAARALLLAKELKP